eukprot:bmy_08979T0
MEERASCGGAWDAASGLSALRSLAPELWQVLLWLRLWWPDVRLPTRTPVSRSPRRYLGHGLEGLSSQVSNGASPQDERTTSLLVFAFLQSCPHSRCHQELEVLGHELPVRVAHDDELQTDGNWCSHFREGAAETGRRRASLHGPDLDCGAFGHRSTPCTAEQASPSPVS